MDNNSTNLVDISNFRITKLFLLQFTRIV